MSEVLPTKEDVSSNRPIVHAVAPAHIVPGGRVKIHGEGFDPLRAPAHRVFFGERLAEVSRVSRHTIAATVPQDALAEIPEVRVELDESSSRPHPVSVAHVLADELQPVANPVFDADKRLYVTLSGARGEKVPVCVYRIGTEGEIEPYLGDILNPTGLAFGPDGDLFISSREDGSVYRVSTEREIAVYADELGTATGIAFDPEGVLYVGDRRGTIFRVERNGEPRSFCRLEPSVSAYHLAFDREGQLFVAAPSLSSVDSIYRISPKGVVDVFCGGFGRPQGLAFDDEGFLYVADGLVGDSGVYRVDSSGEAERIVATPPIVGIAFDGDGGMVLAGTSTVYKLDIGIVGFAG